MSQFTDWMQEKFNTPSIKGYDEKFNKLKSEFIEMGQLKSDFDIEKYTVKKEGNFIAHNFHFLMRQYVLALSEARRMLIERDEKVRKLAEYQKILDEEATLPNARDPKTIKVKVLTDKGQEEKYIDLEMQQTMNQIDLQEVTMTNKLAMVDRFEKARNKLIEMNGGKSPSNEQYQKEEPKYWKWFLERKALWQAKARQTGISEGIWENIHYLEEPALINPEFQVPMLNDTNGMLDLQTIEKELNEKLGYKDRVKLIEESMKKKEG